ncbi:hypothetical protein DRQ53_04540 [bacterium]|nr:MAG: hypothetical protein DRQ53_04540 [bacterium]
MVRLSALPARYTISVALVRQSTHHLLTPAHSGQIPQVIVSSPGGLDCAFAARRIEVLDGVGSDRLALFRGRVGVSPVPAAR